MLASFNLNEDGKLKCPRCGAITSKEEAENNEICKDTSGFAEGFESVEQLSAIKK
jgi:hypothetical protein